MCNAQKTVGHDAPHFDEPPETPAPLFAVRAFKTAIFGTPHPQQTRISPQKEPEDEHDNIEPNVLSDHSENSHAPKEKDKLGVGIGPGNKPATNTKLDIPASPSKGILLTPGTATTRRKTVSFGSTEAKEEIRIKKYDNGAEANNQLGRTENGSQQHATLENKAPQSALTKTLIELSKQRAMKEPDPEGSPIEEKKSESESNIDFKIGTGSVSDADTTMDLSQPRSRSGRHWKLEYDQYHKRSNREMKKIIKYGQNVRSYAAKKDAEATMLNQKLKRASVKVAAMEAEVTRLAAHLNKAQVQEPDRESDRAKLVDELAKQTALVISYKQKAEEYRKTLKKINPQSVILDAQDEAPEEETADILQQNTNDIDTERQIVDNANLHAELQNLRLSAKAAEDKAATLEKENAALKRSLARVKEEMMSYETRRQAREERLVRREAKHKAAEEECERRLAKLTVEHQELLLLQGSGGLPDVDMMAEIRSIQVEAGMEGLDNNQEESTETKATLNRDKENTQPPRNDGKVSKPYISPRKKRLQKSAVDIWTQSSSPRNDTDNPPSTKEPTEMPPSSVKHDIQRTLKDIDQNLVANPTRQEKPQRNVDPNHVAKALPSASLKPSTRTSTNPATTSSDSPHPYPAPPKGPSTATKGRSPSLMSRAADSRTDSMVSARGSAALSAERVMAAKQRLVRRREGKLGRNG